MRRRTFIFSLSLFVESKEKEDSFVFSICRRVIVQEEEEETQAK